MTRLVSSMETDIILRMAELPNPLADSSHAITAFDGDVPCSANGLMSCDDQRKPAKIRFIRTRNRIEYCGAGSVDCKRTDEMSSN